MCTSFSGSCSRDKLITHDGKAWIFNETDVSKAGITTNVVELLAKKINELPKDTLELVKTASCFRTEFYVDTLAQIVAESEDEVSKALLPAFREGLLVKQETGVGFVHDRVIDAAYSLIDDTAKKRCTTISARPCWPPPRTRSWMRS